MTCQPRLSSTSMWGCPLLLLLAMLLPPGSRALRPLSTDEATTSIPAYCKKVGQPRGLVLSGPRRPFTTGSQPTCIPIAMTVITPSHTPDLVAQVLCCCCCLGF